MPPGLLGASWKRGKEEAEEEQGQEERAGALAPRGGADVARTGLSELLPELLLQLRWC